VSRVPTFLLVRCRTTVVHMAIRDKANFLVVELDVEFGGRKRIIRSYESTTLYCS